MTIYIRENPFLSTITLIFGIWKKYIFPESLFFSAILLPTKIRRTFRGIKYTRKMKIQMDEGRGGDNF